MINAPVMELGELAQAKMDPDITLLLNPAWVSKFRKLPLYLGVLVIFIGASSLLGWQFDLTLFKSVSPEWVSIKPIVAVALISGGGSLILQSLKERKHRDILLGKVLGFTTTLIGALDLLGFRLAVAPARTFAPLTAINLIVTGIALVLLGKDIFKKHPISHILAFLVLLLTLLPLVGYLYGTEFQIGVGIYCDMAFPTAIGLLALEISLLFWKLDHDLIAVLVSDGPGGFMSRRLLPFSILTLLILGWLRIAGEDHHLISATFGTAMFTTAAIACTSGFIWQQSIVLQRLELHRAINARERERLKIEGEMRDQFVSMLSHDLRTPITAANMQAQMIVRNSHSEEQCKSYAFQIQQSLQRMNDMVRDLLDASRIRAGCPFPIDPKPSYLSEIVTTAISELSSVYGNRFVTALDGALTGSWDPGALRRAIENLCSNAIKYGDPHSPIRITTKSLQEKRVQIEVHNQGAPIPPEEQTKLFELFQRSPQGESSRKTGWGVGLGLVRAIAEAHGGSAHVESTASHGTSFTIVLKR